jgi:hypothetical protein
VRSFLRDMRSHDLEPRGAAIVVANLVDPRRVPGAHARAHAEEIKLYRAAVEATLDACGLRVTTLLHERVRAAAIAQLGLNGQQLDAMLKVFSRSVGTPWRAPEKHAALAAWLALSTSGDRRSAGRRR